MLSLINVLSLISFKVLLIMNIMRMNSMEQNPFWEASSRSPNQEIPNLYGTEN
jgi:hypothetical protein